MANVKHICITGQVPFDISSRAIAQPFWAQFASPVLDLTIQYGATRYVFNRVIDPDHPVPDGETCLYDFTLSGYESLSWGWFEEFYRAVELCGGRILSKDVIDDQDSCLPKKR